MNNLLNNADVAVVEAAAAAGQTELTTDVIDLAGYTGVLLVAHLGDVTTGSVLGFTVDQSPTGTGDWVAVEGALAHTADATDADNKLLVIDVVRPEERFLRARLTRTVANAVCNGVTALKYGAVFAPVEQGDTVLASATIANATAA